MRRILYIFLSLGHLCLHAQTIDSASAIGLETSDLLSDQQADQVVEREMKLQERQAKLEDRRLLSERAISRSEADMGNYKIKFNRVTVSSSTKKKDDANLSDLATVEGAAIPEDSKEFYTETLIHQFITCTVYDGQITELTFAHDGSLYRAFVNINFNFLRNIGELQVGDQYYSITVATGNQTREQVMELNQLAALENWPDYEPKWLPTISDFSPSLVEYIVLSEGVDEKINDEAFAGISAMIEYYLAHRENLETEYYNAVALKEAQRRYLEANPPKPRDTIVNFAPSAKSKSLRNQ